MTSRATAFVALVVAALLSTADADGPYSRWMQVTMPRFTCNIFNANNLKSPMRLVVNAATNGDLSGDLRTHCSNKDELIVFFFVKDLSLNVSQELDRDANALMERELEDVLNFGISLGNINVGVAPADTCTATNAAYSWKDTEQNQCIAVRCTEGFELVADDNICRVPVTPEDEGDDGLATGAIVAIIVSVVIILLIAVGAACWFCRGKKEAEGGDMELRTTEGCSEPVSSAM